MARVRHQSAAGSAGGRAPESSKKAMGRQTTTKNATASESIDGLCDEVSGALGSARRSSAKRLAGGNIGASLSGPEDNTPVATRLHGSWLARGRSSDSRAILWRLLRTRRGAQVVVLPLAARTRRGAQVVLLPLAAPREQPLPALATASCSSMMLISSTRSSTFLTEAPSRRPPQPQWQATARTWPRPWARGASRAPSSGRGGPCAGPSGRSRCARRSGGRSR